MTPDVIKTIADIGSTAAVIIVTLYFLRFIEKRDRDWQAFFTALLNNKDVPLLKISEALETLLSEFRSHDQMERTKLEEMSKVIHARDNTKPRKQVQT